MKRYRVRALEKLERGVVCPFLYTRKQLKFLHWVYLDKVKRLDISFLDFPSKEVMGKLKYSLEHHYIGFEHYRAMIQEPK